MKKISRFHFLTQDIPDFSHAELAEFACKGGSDWIQLRVKNKSFDEWLAIAKETKFICEKYNSKLIINDNVLVAKETGADGVHLGREDMNPKAARKILGEKFIIGGTANTMEDIEFMIRGGVDYIGLGPFRYTSTKEKLKPVLGEGGIEEIIISSSLPKKIPIIAIGGIKIGDLNVLMNCGVYGVAVSSAINLNEDKISMTEQFVKYLKN